MTNLFKRFFTHKSKFLLIIISLLGLAFSYSCSCRDNPVAPPPETPEGEDNTEPKILTPSATLSRNVMIVNADGNDTPYPITITVTDADISSYTVSGLDGLELQKNGDVFSVKNGFDKIGNTGTDITLNVNYQKKSTAGANDTIAEGKDTGEIKFKVLKAKSLTDDEIAKDLSALLTIGSFKFGNKFSISSGIGTMYEKDKVDTEINTGDFVSALKTEIKKSTDIEKVEGVDFIGVVVSSSGQEATFEFILRVKEEYETIYNDKETPLKIKVVIGDTANGQGGSGKWKDTSTK